MRSQSGLLSSPLPVGEPSPNEIAMEVSEVARVLFLKKKSGISPVRYIAWLYKHFGLPERLNTGKVRHLIREKPRL